MRICHVITRLIIGGAQENTILTCHGLAQRGHDVTLAAGPETGPEGSLWPQAGQAGCRLARLRHMRRAVSPVRDVLARRELIRLIRDGAFDVVHTHSSKAGIIGRSAAVAARTPILVHTIHGMSFNRTQPRAVQAMFRLAERRAARRTDMFVCVADAMTEQSVAAGLAPRDRFVTIRSGMEVDRFRPDGDERRAVRRAWGATDDDVVVGTVARLFDNKGYDEILAAMPMIVSAAPRVRFVWIGDGARREQYRRRLQELGLLDRVIFAGLLTPEDVARQIRGFDILLHASRWEGLPRAVVQALLCEVPAVSFDNDGAREVVLPGETGLLAPLGDVAELARVVTMLVRDPQTRMRMGQSGRRRCQVEFDWRVMVDRLEALYRDLIGRTGKPAC